MKLKGILNLTKIERNSVGMKPTQRKTRESTDFGLVSKKKTQLKA